MGNLVSAGAKSGGGKVVMADGSVRALSEPVSVAELMMDHPRHFVVDAHALRQQEKQRKAAAKVAPLPADHVLGGGRVYVLLPAVRGKVSADEARRVLASAASLARSSSMPGELRRKLSFRKSREEADDDERSAPFAEADRTEGTEAMAAEGPFEEHRPEFLSRELSIRGWKPSLNTIEERVMPKKVYHWLF